VTVRQTPPENPPANTLLGERWWSRHVGVRIQMFGQAGAKAHMGATPKPPENNKRIGETAAVDGVTIVSSIVGPSATFAALHEPFEAHPQIDSFEKIAQTDDGLAVRVVGRAGSGINDRLMIRVGQQAGQSVTLSAGGESFTFAGHAFVRLGGQSVTACGDLREMTLRLGNAGPKLTVNGATAEARVADGFLYWKK